MTIFKTIPLLLLILCFSFTTVNIPTPPLDLHAEIVNWQQNGVLLVRLRTQENRIKSLHRAGKSLAAKELEYERRQYHHFLREAFRNHYNFSAVYFFFNRDAHRVFAGDYQGTLFDVNGHQALHPPNGQTAYVLDSYFPRHPYFQNHRNEEEGFVIKKVLYSGIAQRISTTSPYVFFASTQLNKPQQVQRFNKRVMDFNETLWKRLTIAKIKIAEQREMILVKEDE